MSPAEGAGIGRASGRRRMAAWLLAAIGLPCGVFAGAAAAGPAPATATATATAPATIPTSATAPPDAVIPVDATRRSGYLDMSAATQAMQRDDAANPGMLAVLAGDALWREPAPGARPACGHCHGEPARLRGVATRYPAFDASSGRPISLEGRINACRERHQQAPAWAWESPPLLALAALIGHQSRGLPIAPPADPRLAEHRERGRLRFETRIGQMNLSCADCHDRLAGRSLGGTPIPQGHPTGYPLYRLQWQALGSLQRRLRNCMTGIRAQPHAAGSAELVELELHLFARAAGMVLETPAVRP